MGGGGAGGSGGATMMAPNLYFSEYIEVDTIADAFEIYNATGAAFDLAGCEVRVHYGAVAMGTPQPISGTVAAGEVFVLCLERFSTACDALAPMLVDLSGDDAVELACPVPRGSTTMVTLDIIGRYGAGAGFDPGAQWGTNGATGGTQNRTLRRRCTVTTGDRNATDAFTPNDEWRPFDVDTVGGLGARTCPCNNPPDLTCP
jgi:hypothetical protein